MRVRRPALPLTALLLVLAAPLSAQRPASYDARAIREFRVDAAHSRVAFSIGFLGHAVRGQFDDVQGTIVYAPTSSGTLERSAVTIAIATRGINTGSAHRDEHLRSADFFDAAKYPVILFQSRTIVPSSDGYVMTGVLAMHGVTRVVTIPFRTASPTPAQDPHGSSLVFFTGALRLARMDFGIRGGSTYNDWFDTIRSATMGDSVDITLEIDGWATDFDRSHRHDGAVGKIEKDGVASVVGGSRAMRAKDPSALKDAEWEFDQVGWALLARGRTADAFELFKLNVDLYPRSADAHAALARAYEVAGARDSAATAAALALKLDSVHTRALELKRRLAF